MHVEDGGNVDPAEALIFPGLRALPPVAVAFVVRVGLAITRQGRVRILLMQSQCVFEQAIWGPSDPGSVVTLTGGRRTRFFRS
ncbi:hypothetical protein [Micromonospora sp. NPDC049645]|uniref:hypothetical protein n=1 Tax=Micromonospora sp. NPDC049645 TaxID=3155508 RepID=UPI003445FDE9